MCILDRFTQVFMSNPDEWRDEILKVVVERDHICVLTDERDDQYGIGFQIHFSGVYAITLKDRLKEISRF